MARNLAHVQLKVRQAMRHAIVNPPNAATFAVLLVIRATVGHDGSRGTGTETTQEKLAAQQGLAATVWYLERVCEGPAPQGQQSEACERLMEA